jgi:pimeloyl-ACP methyl ester carboxylesterase
MHERFLDAGVAVAGVDVGGAYGTPNGRELFTAPYRELTARRGFAPRPCLLGRSRGGRWVTSWAADHPDRVTGLAGIYRVFGLRSYPGLARAAPACGLTPKGLESRLGDLNPIERAGPLGKARVPALLIHGDEDKVVPPKENSAALVARYKAQGAEEVVKSIIVEGQGHNVREGCFRCQELADFVAARARGG